MPIAGKLTAKQDRLATVIAAGLAETVTEAGLKAGYKHLPSTSRALRDANLQREIEIRRNARRDTAKALRVRALSGAHKHLDRLEDARDLAQVAVIAATVEEKIGGDEEKGVSRRHYLELAYRLLLAWAAGASQFIPRDGPIPPRLDRAHARLESLQSEMMRVELTER